MKSHQNKFEIVTRPDVLGGCGCGEEVETAAAAAAPLPLPLPPPRGPTDPPYEPPLVFPPPPLCPLPPPLDCGGGIMACSDDVAVGGDMLKLQEERMNDFRITRKWANKNSVFDPYSDASLEKNEPPVWSALQPALAPLTSADSLCCRLTRV